MPIPSSTDWKMNVVLPNTLRSHGVTTHRGHYKLIEARMASNKNSATGLTTAFADLDRVTCRLANPVRRLILLPVLAGR